MLQELRYSMIRSADSATASFCARCGSIGQSVTSSGRKYCCQDCFHLDQQMHEIESQAIDELESLNIEGNTESMRLIIRIAAQKHQEICDFKLTLGTPEFPRVGECNLFAHAMSLEAPVKSLSEESRRDVMDVAEALSQILARANIPLPPDEINHLLLAIQSNAHRIVDSSQRTIGLGLFLFASMLNHSCCPNCSHSFVFTSGKLPMIAMQAIRDIEMGEEITFNYVALYQSTNQRRKILESAYSFLCSCDRCVVATNSSSNAKSEQYPNDEILSSTNSSPHKLREDWAVKKLDYTTPLSCSPKTLQALRAEVTMCSNLLTQASASAKACNSILRKLVQFCSNSNKAGMLHPCHEVMFCASVACARSARGLLSTDDSNINSSDHTFAAQAAVGYGGMALGSMLKFTRLRNREVGELEGIIAEGLKALESKQLSYADGDKSELSASFEAICRHCLDSLGYVWSSDDLIVDLLRHASMYASLYHTVVNAPQLLSRAFEASSEISAMATCSD